jgi:hypothetical protein
MHSKVLDAYFPPLYLRSRIQITRSNLWNQRRKASTAMLDSRICLLSDKTNCMYAPLLRIHVLAYLALSYGRSVGLFDARFYEHLHMYLQC